MASFTQEKFDMPEKPPIWEFRMKVILSGVRIFLGSGLRV